MSIRTTANVALVSAAAWIVSAAPAQTEVIYVNRSASGANNGDNTSAGNSGNGPPPIVEMQANEQADVGSEPFRIFFVPAGAAPNAYSSGPTVVSIAGHVGGTMSFDVFIEKSPLDVRAVAADFPCVLSGGLTGSIAYVQDSAFADMGRPDFVFFNSDVNLTASLDQGCSPNLRSAMARNSGAVPVATSKYLLTFDLAVSGDADGTFTLDFVFPGTGAFAATTDRIPGLIGSSLIIEPDCNDNGIDDDCDVSCGPLHCDSNTCGTTEDCNGNGIPDECDLNDGTLVDENNDGIPDGCETWTGGGRDMFWGNLLNWNPPIVPNGAGFFANIRGENQTVILNINAAIDALNLLNGPTLNITQGDLIVATTAGILNGGTIVVDNGYSLDSVGEFVMERSPPTTGTAGAPGSSAIVAEPKLEVRDSTSVNLLSLVSLDGGDVLVADTAQVTITESMTLAGGATYQEIPDHGSDTSAKLTAGSILLTSNRLGDGTMILQDEMKVVVESSTAPRTTATFSGDPQGSLPSPTPAIAATIKLECVAGGTSLSRGGCTPPRLGLALGGNATLKAEAMIVDGRTVDVAGQILESGQPNIDIAGQLILEGFGVYQADPERLGSTGAWLASGSVLITTDEVGEGGLMVLEDAMLVQTSANFALNIATSCPALLRGGCTPPRLTMRGGSNLQIGGRLVIGEGTEISIGPFSGDPQGSAPRNSQAAGQSVRLTGDFDNYVTDPLAFEWDSGTLTLKGVNQRFEVAGQDRAFAISGFDNNFAFGVIEVVSDADVTFVDDRDNFGGREAEALYVHKLILQAGASITIDGVNVYYQELTNDGALVTLLNGGSLQGMDCEADADCHDFSPCTFDRCLGASCANDTIAYGDLAGVGGSCGPDGLVNLLDILAVLDAFQSLFADGCAPSDIDIAGPGGSCGSDGSVNLIDILAILDAFEGSSDCCADGP